MNLDSRLNRLGGVAVLIGSILAGTALALTPHGYTDPLRPLASLTALGGAVLIVLGAPAVFRRVWERSFVLGIIAYAGMITTLLLFQVGAGAVEGTILPYLARHGELPDKLPVALGGLEKLALLAQVMGTICLAGRDPAPQALSVVARGAPPAFDPGRLPSASHPVGRHSHLRQPRDHGRNDAVRAPHPGRGRARSINDRSAGLKL